MPQSAGMAGLFCTFGPCRHSLVSRWTLHGAPASRVPVSFRQLGDLAEAIVSEVGKQSWRWSSRPTRYTTQQTPVEPCASCHSYPAMPQQLKGCPRPPSSRCCISSSSDISSCCQYPPEAPCPQTPGQGDPSTHRASRFDGQFQVNLRHDSEANCLGRSDARRWFGPPRHCRHCGRLPGLLRLGFAHRTLRDHGQRGDLDSSSEQVRKYLSGPWIRPYISSPVLAAGSERTIQVCACGGYLSAARHPEGMPQTP